MNSRPYLRWLLEHTIEQSNLKDCGIHLKARGVPLFVEPILDQVKDGAAFLKRHRNPEEVRDCERRNRGRMT